MKVFVFRVTDVCNKRCPTCCCPRKQVVLGLDPFERKLREIRDYASRHKETPTICLTGGEPFFYASTDSSMGKQNVVGLVERVVSILPATKIIIKTAGWTPHSVLDSRLKRVQATAGEDVLDVRLGFNLFQNLGSDAQERLHHMLELILPYQPTMRVESIYDQTNFDQLFEVIRSVLAAWGVPTDLNIAALIRNPNIPYRFEIPLQCAGSTAFRQNCGEMTLVLDTMPAYCGLACDSVRPFFEAEWFRPCPTIEFGPEHIMYNADLSFFHCNDSFADYAVPPFPAAYLESVESQSAFLERRFRALRRTMRSRRLRFRKRREQCIFCTSFIHSGIQA